jgi:hypothetical protein
MRKFSTDPGYYKEFRKRIEQQMNENFSNSSKASEEQVKARLVGCMNLLLMLQMTKNLIVGREIDEKGHRFT